VVSQCTPLPIFFAAKHFFVMFYILTPLAGASAPSTPALGNGFGRESCPSLTVLL
jgi:hypothetical protein